MRILQIVYQKELLVVFVFLFDFSSLFVGIQGAKIREFSSKEKKYCFEIVAQGRKGLKKYSFVCETSSERKTWLDQLNRVSKAGSMAIRLDGDLQLPEEDTSNPLREPSESGSPSIYEDDGGADVQLSFLRKSSNRPPPAGLEGYLFKKSPSLMTGWQKRYFVLKDPGEVNYYETVRNFPFYLMYLSEKNS